MIDIVEPTVERLRKDEFSSPLVDSKNDRRAWRKLDIFQTLLRDNKIQTAHCDAGERFIRHYMGVRKYDVRITDLHTVSNASLDGVMDPWQYHGSRLAEARLHLLSDEYGAMEVLAKHETDPELSLSNPIIFIGACYGGYKSRKEGMGYGLRLVISALERLAFLWGLKSKGN